MTDQGGYPLSHRQLLIAVYLLLACCGVLPSTVHALGQPYFESVVGTADISNGIITVMAQDRSGLIWMGTPEGLYSFDGQRLRAFRNQPDDPSSLGDDYIRALLPHSDGRLWVATQGAGLSVYDPRSDSFEQFRPQPGDPDSLPSLAALSLAEAPDGDVWVGFGNNGLARWDSGDRRFHDTATPAAVPMCCTMPPCVACCSIASATSGSAPATACNSIAPAVHASSGWRRNPK